MFKVQIHLICAFFFAHARSAKHMQEARAEKPGEYVANMRLLHFKRTCIHTHKYIHTHARARTQARSFKPLSVQKYPALTGVGTVSVSAC